MPRSHAESAEALKMDSDELAVVIGRAKGKLYSVRSQRIWPGLDDKVLTSWNGLMLAAFAEAGRVLKRPDYTAVAIKNGEFLHATMHTAEGRLLRTWKDVGKGSAAKLNGYLEDYAFLADGLLALYETTFDDRWFTWASSLIEQTFAHFVDPDGGFYDTSDDHESLIFRPKELQDNAVPCGGSAMAYLLARMALLTGKHEYAAAAETSTSKMTQMFERYPLGFAHWLNGAAQLMGSGREIAIVHDGDIATAQPLIDAARAAMGPNDVIAVGAADSVVPLLANRPLVEGKPAAYVCRNFACQLPVTTPTDLQKQLR